MRLLFCLLIFSQLFSFISVFADENKKESLESNLIKWEKVIENKHNKFKNIEWKSYDDNNSDLKNTTLDKNSKNNFSNTKKKKFYFSNHRKNNEFDKVQPLFTSNDFLNDGEMNLSTYWISSFRGGAGGGTGHQNYAIKFNYGLSDDSLFSIYLSESDDPLYKLIDGEIIPNNWASVALGYKKKLFQSEYSKSSLSFSGFIEYWVVSSGSGNFNGMGSKKSIYNELDNTTGLDRHEKFIYSFSLPFTKELNKKTKFLIAPGATFIPDTIGDKNIGKNFYGKNFFLQSGLNFDVATNIQFISSYTYLFGPGHNSFDENLKYNRFPIYSLGLNWNINRIIGIEGKLTNAYGATPSTFLLTIPSDNQPLYYLGANYKPFGKDTKFNPLYKKNKLLLFGGVTVDNALFPERGMSQISFNYDEKGNLFAFYGYSLSNIFQIEIRTGSFNEIDLGDNSHSNLYKAYFNSDDFNYRFGGKLLIFSPQKDDLFWMTLRTSLGRSLGSSRQGYMFTELINTIRLNDWVALNISPKYFFSGLKNYGGLGVSSYINLLDNLQLIPEINTSFINDSNLNSTIALRYSYSPQSSMDLYYSNAAGIQDIGSLSEDKENRFGIKLNFLY